MFPNSEWRPCHANIPLIFLIFSAPIQDVNKFHLQNILGKKKNCLHFPYTHARVFKYLLQSHIQMMCIYNAVYVAAIVCALFSIKLTQIVCQFSY